MDNLAHTLCGSALWRSRLLPAGRLTGATLIVAANAPDVDAVYYLLGDPIGALLHRRGWTHSFAGLALEIPLLAGLAFAAGRLGAGRRDEPLSFRALLAASAAGYLSHLLLDLLNTYGVRFLMPFERRWFYGDMAFIVDPWMWLLFGAATLLGGRLGWPAHALWGLFGIAGGSVLLGSPEVPGAAAGIWVVAVAATWLAGARLSPRAVETPGAAPLAWAWPGRPARAGAAARALLALAIVYLVALKAGSVLARERALEFLARTEELPRAALESTVGPAPAVPWRWTVVAAAPEHIYRVPLSLGGREPRIAHVLPRHLDEPALELVQETREYRAWRVFARHPFTARRGDLLVLGDGRYSTGDADDWANLVLPLPDLPER